jgi:chloramphenicol 3-O phosphotransferase
VITPLDVLEARENRRSERIKGSARSQYFKVHENVAYDIEIDSHRDDLKENVQRIQNALNKKFPEHKIKNIK